MDSTMLCHGHFASLPHSRLQALIGLDEREPQDVGDWENPPSAGREATEEDRKAGLRLDAFATAQIDQIHR